MMYSNDRTCFLELGLKIKQSCSFTKTCENETICVSIIIFSGWAVPLTLRMVFTFRKYFDFPVFALNLLFLQLTHKHAVFDIEGLDVLSSGISARA